MTSLPLKINNWVYLFVLCLALASLSFYLTGEPYRHTYAPGEVLFAKVNSLTSTNTLIPFSYYSLPFCLPQDGIKRSDGGNIGGALMGDQLMNSPYRFLMNANQSKYLCTTRPLSRDDVKLMEERTRGLYQVNMDLDSMPVRRIAKEFKSTGFPVGYELPTGKDVYVLNHLKFRISVNERITEHGHGYEVVGFEVVPCSVHSNPNEAVAAKRRMYDDVDSMNCPFEIDGLQIVREKEMISFTYEAEFVRSNLAWSSRWEPYVEMNVRLLRSSMASSLISILLLSGVVLVILSGSIWKEHDAEVEDALREPSHPKILCVLVGTGVQITIAAVIAVAMALGWSVTPTLHRLVITQLITLYFFSGPVGGYVSVALSKMIRSTVEGWLVVSLLTGLLFPGLSILVHLAVNTVLWNSNSTAAISMSWYSVVLSLWLLVLLPSTVLGGYLSTRVESETIHFPFTVREIPGKTFPSWISVVVASGVIPFGILSLQLVRLLLHVAFNRNYSSSGFLLASLLMFIIGCGEVSLVLTYRNLSMENWRWGWQWQWQSFFASGSIGVYLLLYCLKFLVIDLVGVKHPATVVVYLGYALIATVCVVLSAGAIGVIVALRLRLRLHYSSIKG